MARLQFRHNSETFPTRERAYKYLSDLTDNSTRLSGSFVESLIGEPLVVKYEEDGKEYALLAIGMSGKTGDGILVPYHIIDTAKLEEDITVLSGLTQEMQEQIQDALDSIDTINDNIDSIESSITEMQESIAELDENVVKGVEINNTSETDWEGETGKGIVARVENNIAYFDNFSTDNVKIPDGFEGQFIHHDHSMTDFLKNMENLRIEKVSENLPENVKEAYKLLTSNDVQLGDRIDIYKDQTLKKVELVDIDDQGRKGQFLKFTYLLSNGEEQVVYVDVSKFLVEAEFQSGVTADASGVVHGVVDSTSETFLTVGADGFKVSGIQNAIDTTVETETTRATIKENELQSELDKTQTGAGLAEDGSYVHDHPTNYIDEATSLADADHKLDSALKTVEDKVDSLSASTESLSANTVSEISRLDTKIDAETTRATEKETELNNKIDTVKTDLETEIENSTSDLDSKISELSAATESEISRATAKENEINTKVDSEIERAQNRETELSTMITNLSSEHIADIANLESQIANEETARQAADTALSNRIDELEDNIVVGENAIDVTVADDTAKVTLKISAADNVLTQDANGLKTNLSVGIVREDDVEYIVLKGKDGVELSKVNANKFVKDGMLDRAYLENNNLVLIFNTDSGKEPIIIPLSDLIPVYTAGTYLTLENNVFDARVGEGGLATNESVVLLDNKVNEKIAQLDGTYLQPGSIRNIINTTFSDPLTHTPIGTQAEADNNNLMRYYHPEGGADGDVRYYVSNKTTDMVHGEENLGDVIDTMKEKIDKIGDDIEERVQIVESALTQEIIDRQNGDDALWEALSAETEDRNNKERVISAALNDLNTKTSILSGKTESLENKVEELSGRTVDLTGYFNGVNYETSGETPQIVFTDNTGNVVGSIDASDFIVDGMLSSVTFSDGILHLVFNTDAGKQDIDVSLGDIFDSDLYYTKEEADELFMPAINEKVISAALNNLNGKITTVQNDLQELSGAVVNNYYTKSEISGKERVVSTALNQLNERIEEVAEEAGSSEALVHLSGVVVNNVEDITNIEEQIAILSAKTVDLSPYYTSAQTHDIFLSKETYEIDEKVIAAAFNDLNDRLLNTPLKQDVYTKEEVDALIEGISGNIQSAVYNALKQILVGVQREIKITPNDSNNTITLGFDDNAVFGNMS